MKKYLGILILFVIGIKTMHGWQHVMDISFSDEAAYLQNGINGINNIRLEWGPAYGLWYKLLHFFIQDPVQLYYFNFYVTTLLLSILVYIFLIRIKINTYVALLLSVSLLISPLNLLLLPRITHFVLILLFAGCILSTFIGSDFRKWLVLTSAVFICSYARPEFYLTFVFSLVYLIYVYFKTKTIIKKDRIILAFFIFLLVLVQWKIGKPDDNYAHYKRDAAAFIQHYLAMNKQKLHLPDDVSTVWFEVAREQFKACTSLNDIFIHYPEVVIKHLLHNVVPFFISSTFIFVVILSPFAALTSLKLAVILSCLYFLILFWFFIRKRKDLMFQIMLMVKDNKWIFLLSFFISIPILAGSFIVAPRLHYIFIFTIWLLPIFAIFLHVLFTNYLLEKWQKNIALIFSISVLFFYPTILQYKIMVFSISEKNNDFTNLMLVNYLSDYFSTSEVRFLSSFDHVNGYLGGNFTEYTTLMDKDRDSLFTNFLAQKDLNMILTPSLLNKSSDFKNDSSWHYFVHHYKEFGFDSIVIKNKTSSLDLFVKKNLISSSVINQ